MTVRARESHQSNSRCLRDTGGSARHVPRLALALLLAFGLAESKAVDIHLIHGRVVHVTDGDTLSVVIDGGRRLTVELADIDAPESGEPYARTAKKALGRIVFGREVRLEPVAVGSQQPGATRVYLGDLDLSAELVYRGYARAAPGADSSRDLTGLEGAARRARRGLWSSATNRASWP